MTAESVRRKPYDMTVPEEVLAIAERWWRHLSIAEMKEYEATYFPGHSWELLGRRAHHQIWEIEGKPK